VKLASLKNGTRDGTLVIVSQRPEDPGLRERGRACFKPPSITGRPRPSSCRRSRIGSARASSMATVVRSPPTRPEPSPRCLAPTSASTAVPLGVSSHAAAGHIVLVGLVNDVSLRGPIAAEMATGFGPITAKPSSALAPVVVTPDELGSAWSVNGIDLAAKVRCKR
jgi:hypothetical protein